MNSTCAPNPTNRGAQIPRRDTENPPVTVGLGWFEGTYWTREPAAALRRFEDTLEVDLTPRARGFGRYPAVWVAGDGAWVGFARDDAEQLHFQVKQMAGEHLGEQRLERLAAWIGELERWKFSRVDLAANDAARRVEVADVRAAILAGDRVGRASRFRWIDDLNGAHSLYVGSPSSQHQLRIYDKDREQSAPIGTYGIRWENQLRDEAATDLVERYFGVGRQAGTTRSAQEVMWPVTARLIDFRERGSNERSTRRRRLGWWQELIGEAPKADLERDRAGDDLERLAEWIKTQCGPTLARLLDDPRYGDAFLDQVVEEGRRKLGRAEAKLDERLRRRA